MISPVPKAPPGDELLRLYAELAADNSVVSAADTDDLGAAEQVRQVRRALEMLESFRRSTRGDSVAPPDDSGTQTPAVQCIGPFEVLYEVGRGGWGVVYRAHDLRNRHEVALKLPLLDYAGHPQFGRRFVREAKMLESLQHPNLVRVHEAGELGWIWYLALEFCEGPNLKQWLTSQGGRISARPAAAIVAAVADGLQHVHEHGILHRDIKPTNILLHERTCVASPVEVELPFVPRLADFGLAKLTASTGDTTHEGMLIGTPAYMSPEQALGRLREVCPASDTFALGVVLFELLSGRTPFSGEDDLEIRYRIAKELAPELGEIDAKLPASIASICRKSLAKDPRDRYQTAREMAEDLRRFLHGEPVHAPGALRRRARRLSRRVLLGAASIGAIGVAAVGLWRWRQPHSRPERGFQPSVVPFVPDKRLLGDWLFHRSELDGRRVRDRAGRVDAVIQGGYDFVPAGKLESLQFDGRTTVIHLGRLDENVPIPKESFTAEVWVRVDEPLTWGSLVGLFQDNGSQENGWCLGFFHDKFSFSLKAAARRSWMIHLVDTTPYELGAWYQVAGTYDGTLQRLYVNGRLLGESRLEHGPISYPKWGYYEIGCYHDVDEFRTMKGYLHEVRVYDAALSATEIAERFAARHDELPNVEAPRERKARVWTSLTTIFEPNPGKGAAAPGSATPSGAGGKSKNK